MIQLAFSTCTKLGLKVMGILNTSKAKKSTSLYQGYRAYEAMINSKHCFISVILMKNLSEIVWFFSHWIKDHVRIRFYHTENSSTVSINIKALKFNYDLTSYCPDLVRARNPLYGRVGRFLKSSFSIFKPESATPKILNPTRNVGNTWSRSTPVSNTNVPVIEGVLSLGILPMDQVHVCTNKSTCQRQN